MARATLTQRVEVLEQTGEGLASLPTRMSAVERELSEFRVEVRNELAAVRGELGTVRRDLDGVRHELGAVRGAVSGELRAEIQIVDSDMRALGRSLRAEVGTLGSSLREMDESIRAELAQIRVGDEDTRRFMRVLYEDLVERIKTIGEGIGGQQSS